MNRHPAVPLRLQVARGILVLGVLMSAARVRAQSDDGPIVIGQRRKLEPLHFNPPTVALDLSGVYRQDRSESSVGVDRFHETFFTQSLSIDTLGYMYSPGFIELKLSGEGGITESFSDFNGSSATQLSELFSWDASATYRKDGNTPFTLFSQRNQQWINREFGPTIESITTNTGAQLGIRKGFSVTRLTLSRVDSEQAGIEGSPDYRYTRDLFSWNTVLRPNAHNTLNWEYNFSRVNQAGVSEQDYDSHDAALDHELIFGRADRHTLSSRLDYHLDTGDHERQYGRLYERLRLRHSETFETRYEYRLDYYRFPESQRVRNSGRAGFLHRLYQSLLTTGNVSAAYATESAGDFSSTDLGADLNFDYRKRVPYGRFFGTLGFQVDQQDNSARGASSLIIDQSAAFSDPLPVILNGSNISPSGVVVTDPTGLIVYTPGIDYTVTKFADRVEISRVIGGSIANLSPILLDYLLLPQAGNTISTQTISTTARYAFEQSALKGLSLYGGYSHQNQSIDTMDPAAFTPNGYDDYVYGAEYTIGSWTGGGERHIHDSRLIPLETERYYLRYSRRFDDLTASGNATYTILDYSDTGNHVELTTLSAQLRYDISRRFFVIATVLWHDQEDQVSGTSRGFEQQVELQWRYRQTTIYGTVRNSTLDTSTDSDSFQFFRLGVRREF